MRKRENTHNLTGLTRKQIMALMTEALFDDFLPSRKVKEGCQWLRSDKAIPSAIMRVLQPTNQNLIDGVARHLFRLVLEENAIHPIPWKIT